MSEPIKAALPPADHFRAAINAAMADPLGPFFWHHAFAALAAADEIVSNVTREPKRLLPPTP